MPLQSTTYVQNSEKWSQRHNPERANEMQYERRQSPLSETRDVSKRELRHLMLNAQGTGISHAVEVCRVRVSKRRSRKQNASLKIASSVAQGNATTSKKTWRPQRVNTIDSRMFWWMRGMKPSISGRESTSLRKSPRAYRKRLSASDAAFERCSQELQQEKIAIVHGVCN